MNRRNRAEDIQKSRPKHTEGSIGSQIDGVGEWAISIEFLALKGLPGTQFLLASLRLMITCIARTDGILLR